MPFILHIESSSKNCSVALAENGVLVGSKSMRSENYIHAEYLHPLIETLMQECKKTLSDLSAVAVSKGPGSYTGLRIGISATKGFCYSLGIPLISLDTTQILASAIKEILPGFDFYVPMIDARRMEVYCANFDKEAKRLSGDEAIILDEKYFEQWQSQHVVFLGDGAEKCRAFISTQQLIWFGQPDATMMCGLAYAKWIEGAFEDVAYYEPFYLKNYLPGITKKTVL